VGEHSCAMLTNMIFEHGGGTDMIGPDLEREFVPIYQRAHTFDGYRHLGGGDDWARITEHQQSVRSSWVESGALSWSLDDLRAALFIEARSIHHSGYPPSERLYVYLRDLDAMITKQVKIPLDCSDDYRKRDLFAEGVWPLGHQRRFGAVVFDDRGCVLLREPRNHFAGYTWTFAKGKGSANEHPVDTARRVVADEFGIPEAVIAIIGHVPGTYSGSSGGTNNYFFVARAVSILPEPHGDTVTARWFSPAQAETMIGTTKDKGGRERDLHLLQAAVGEYNALTSPPKTPHTSDDPDEDESVWETPPISDSSDAGISDALNLLPGEAWDELRRFAVRFREVADDEVGYEFVKYLYRRALIVSFRWFQWNRFGPDPLKTVKRTVRLIHSASAEDTVRLATLIARAEHFGGEEVKIATKKGIFLAIAERLLEWRTPSDLFLVLANRFGVADVTVCPPPWSTGSMHPSWSGEKIAWYFIDDPLDFVLAIDTEGRLVVGRPESQGEDLVLAEAVTTASVDEAERVARQFRHLRRSGDA
jgi:8-oxo-dGTP pyrophosphatase MutT (NUDIX family)